MKLHILALASLALLAFGCGGSGSAPVVTGNSFAGHYNGTWHSPSENADGVIVMTVDPSGKYSCVMQDNTVPGIFTSTGTVTSSGAISGPTSIEGGEVQFGGQLTRNGQAFTGNCALSNGLQETYSLNFSTAAVCPFMGSWSGSYQDPLIHEQGTAASTIDHNGYVSYTSHNTTVGGTYTGYGLIQNNGDFLLLEPSNSSLVDIGTGMLNPQGQLVLPGTETWQGGSTTTVATLTKQ